MSRLTAPTASAASNANVMPLTCVKNRRGSDASRITWASWLTLLALRIAAVLLAWAALLSLGALFYLAGVGMAGLWGYFG